jgi:hypothetical protein
MKTFTHISLSPLLEIRRQLSFFDRQLTTIRHGGKLKTSQFTSRPCPAAFVSPPDSTM